ncbi:hypothetical protein ACP275_10G021700 [Erythranthe tilingii]
MLIWAEILVVYAIWLLMAYLTNVWKLEITHASTIVTILWALLNLLPLLHLFIADFIVSDYWMVFIFSISTSAGMGFLAMSTPPVLARITGKCSEYSPECVGRGQKVLLYTSLPLIAFGVAGPAICYARVIVERRNSGVNNVDSWKKFWRFVNSRSPANIVALIAVLGLPYINPWSLQFGIPAICTLVATLLFSTTLSSYNRKLKPNGSPLTILIQVLVAAVSKLFYRIPKDPKELFEIQNSQLHSVPHTTSLRCLDKAAVIIPTKPIEEQEKNKWRLCRVTEVEETKAIVRMIPVSMTLIFCGVVNAIGFTYFMAQLDQTNPKVGRLKVPALVLVWFYRETGQKCADLSAKLSDYLDVSKSASRKLTSSLGIVVSMILAILCCITAAKVESRRLGVVREHGLVDKPDETVPMTMFWLLPQFLLLGAFDGLFGTGVVHFVFDQFPISMYRYLQYFYRSVLGIGHLCSILTVFAVGKISEKGGKMNWFQHDLNQSRLDKYYYTLAWLLAVNLVVFIVVAVFYRYNESKLKDEEFCVTCELEFDNITVTGECTLNLKCCCC